MTAVDLDNFEEPGNSTGIIEPNYNHCGVSIACTATTFITLNNTLEGLKDV